MVQRLLVATDDSKLSRKAVRYATELAAQTGARLVILHVVPRYPMSYFEGAVSLDPEHVGRVEREWSDQARELVDRLAAKAIEEGVQARGVVAQSDEVADSILAAARKHRCDLVVMASHGRRGLGRVLLGSETQKVLAHAALPVLVLR